MEDEMKLTAEEMDGRIVFVMFRSEKFLSLVEAPDGAQAGDEAMVSVGEGPYAIIQYNGHSYQRRCEDYLLHKPGQSVDETLEEAGLDEESLLPRY